MLALLQAQSGISSTDPKSLLQGIFLGLMVVMTIYNFFLYLSLRDKAYLLYGGTAFFGILSAMSLRGLSGEFFWPAYADWDQVLYVAWGSLSMYCSSRFTAVFLNLKERHSRLNKLMWGIALASLSLALVSLFIDFEITKPLGRILVLLSFPAYITTGIIAYRNGYKPALFYVIAWLPYALGIIIRVFYGLGLLPDHILVTSSITFGGALEIVLLSFALADRIRVMRKELVEKELEKGQLRAKLLEEQKVVLEKTVEARTSELKESNETKDKFFSIIAHDLRSPMIGLQGVGQKLEYFIKSNNQQKLLQVGGQIDQSIDQLNHLLNNLLNWASTETASMPFQPLKIDLKALVDENISLYQSLAKVKSVHLINDNQTIMAFADENMMATVIRNLLSNAIKYTRPDTRVTVDLSETESIILLSVQDEGAGMTPDQIKSTADPANHSATGSKGEKGFGLGLKLCHEFAKLHGGQLHAESVLNEGSKFTLSLPKMNSQT